VLLASGCGKLVEESFDFKYIYIVSPGDGAAVLGRDQFPVEVSLECGDVWSIDVFFDGWAAGGWERDLEQAQGCSGDPGTYCVAASTRVALVQGAYWPARMDVRMSCGGFFRQYASEVSRVYLSPFDDLAKVPASARSLFAAEGGVVALSVEGLHRIAAGGEVTGLSNRSPAARAFAVAEDLYYYAPCDGLACDAAAPDLFRIDAPTLAPRGNHARLGCAPLAVLAVGDRRLMALGECGAPRVRWSAPDMTGPLEEPVDVRLTDQAARRGDDGVLLAWRDDELVLIAAGAAPPLASQATGVRGSWAALSADGALAAVLDRDGRLSQIDTATGATVATGVLPQAPAEVVALGFAPGSHRVVIAVPDAMWFVDGAAWLRIDPPLDDEGGALVVRAAALLDGGRILAVAELPSPEPTERLVYVTDGATITLRMWVGPDWTMTAPPFVAADGVLHAAFDTAQGPVVVAHRLGAP
jgi:hypothetical protein